LLTDDLRIDHLSPLLPPAILVEELPLTDNAADTVVAGRAGAEAILDAHDDRLIVVVGPCSIHDPVAGLVYAEQLAEQAQRLADDLHIIMRVYFEKPRTTVGWKGLINDPDLDGSFRVNKGLRRARRFLRDVNERSLPAAVEFLDPITPQFLADLVAWGAIGARTTESQVHREMASGLSMPVGFKNGTGGTVQIAVDALRSASHPHHFLSVTKHGLAAIVKTRGNPHTHVILRGGKKGPNYHPEAVGDAVERMREAGVPPRVMVDCSHANSRKNPLNQPGVAKAVGEQVAADAPGIMGVMLESFLEEGRQSIHDKPLAWGTSVTDGCMGWDRSVEVLDGLAASVRARRQRRRGARSGAAD